MNVLPYSEIFAELLVQIHKGIGICHSQFLEGKPLSERDKKLTELFRPFEKKYRISGLNKHLTKGFNKSVQARQNIYPRLNKLIVDSYLRAQGSKGNRYSAEIIPSPLNILYYALTVPGEGQTSAYPFVLCRSMLFYFLNIHPKHPDLKSIAPTFDEISEENILKSISTFKSHIEIQQRWPDPRSNYDLLSSRINYLNGHILSLKGFTYLWFKDSKQLLNFCFGLDEKNPVVSLQKYYSNNFSIDKKYSFRLSNSYYTLPDSSEIINWAFGVPIPLRGADVLFYGGLKKSSNAGLVISVHGQPGVGKTSAALSLAAVLSPFQTKTVYVSLEENPDDLTTRLRTLIPDYLKWLSIFENNYYNERLKSKEESDLNWFKAFKIKKNLDLSQLTETLQLLKQDLYGLNSISIQENSTLGVSIPSVAPLLLIIDNVNELFTDERKDDNRYDKLDSFIDQCRSMDAIVLLVAAEDIPSKYKLDYLVDVSIHLSQEGLDKKYEKPVRIFQLVKTRHQVSRQGSHVFHLSNSKGFRISPQVPSQMDKKEKLRIQLPSRHEFIHCLNFLREEYTYQNFLPIACNSQILVHGYGSSGKAGFGMKLLLMPVFNKSISNEIQQRKNWFQASSRKKNKVLIVSFLYPVEYYEELHNRILNQFQYFDFRDSEVVVKAFYPGYLTAEDFVYKIVRLLEEANLEGDPYTGILLDGLHNVFLQFKYLQAADMIWPLLYSMLSRYNLTVVTTFTNFSLNENLKGSREESSRSQTQHFDDSMLMQQGQKPFLHGLVKATDYFFSLEESQNEKNNFEREYWLSVNSSIRRLPPKDLLRWDREKLIFIERKSPIDFYFS
jgi:KaiC/GvpD/RAD55 family RecA-like ATPase